MAGPPRLDLLYADIEDPAVPQAETVETFAALVAEGTVLARLIGAEVPVILASRGAVPRTGRRAGRLPSARRA
jgi:aryl-alcohol dehydrogenase-like predicted oxidoreductase